MLKDKFRAIYYRTVKSARIKITILAVLFLVVAALTFLFFGPVDLKTASGRAKILQNNPSFTAVLPLYWQLRKIPDILYIKYFFEHDSVPVYELTIDPDKFAKMDASLPKGFMNVAYTNKVSVPARFQAGDKIYDVEVRYRGDNAVHWNAAKKSYLIKFKNELFDGMSEASFIIPDDRYFALEDFNNYRAKKLGLKTPQSGFANLQINGGAAAFYFTIEGWSQAMLDKWGVSKGSELYGEIDLEAGAGAGLDVWKDPAAWQELTRGDKYPFKKESKLSELLRLLNDAPDEEFYAKIFDLIDKDNFFTWQVNLNLANSSHENLGNIRMYFDKSQGKFFFIPWDVENEPLSSNHFEEYGPLQKRIFQNPEFFREKNERLYAYVSDEKNLQDDLRYYDAIYESFKISLYKDRMKIYSNRWADKVYRERRQIIENVFQNLRDRLVSAN